MTEANDISTAYPYPLFLGVEGALVLVVGGGVVAERRVATLIASGALVTVVAPEATETLATLAREGGLEWHPRDFAPADTAGARLVFAATGIDAVDRRVAEAARATGAFVNVADDAALSDFHVPAIKRRGAIQLAVGTGGAAPGLAARLRDRLATGISPEVVRLADLLGEMRVVARRTVTDSSVRMRALSAAATDSELLARLARGESPSPEAELDRALGRLNDGATEERLSAPASAHVSIVGAGPGAPDLITARGLERIRTADVVIYDDLIDRRLLDEAPATAELVYAGKRGWRDDHDRPGPDAIVERATEGTGRHVVRLKGGDPSVFGRLDEEIAALEAAGVPYEIVPGVTSALAAAASAHLPLTARGVSSSLTLAAAISSGSSDEVANLLPLVCAGGTVAVYMGLRALGTIADQLIAGGIEPTLPVAIVSAASTPAEKVLHAELASAAVVARDHAMQSPAIVILGAVAER